MKKLFLFLFLGAIVFSCDKDEDTSYSKNDILGTWILTSSPSGNGTCENLYTFTSDTLKNSTECGSISSTSFSMPYTYSSNTISYTFIGPIELKIKSLSSEKMVCDYKLNGISIGEYTFDKKD